MSAYRRDFGESKSISFLIKGYELLKKYNQIWKKVKNTIKKEFNSEPVYNAKYLKAKIKSCNRKINTNFHNNKISKKGSYEKVQVFLEKCKYVVKEKKMPEYITDDIEISSDSDRGDSDNEEMKKILMKKNLMQKTLMKKPFCI